jgi:hypothetical protein
VIVEQYGKGNFQLQVAAVLSHTAASAALTADSTAVTATVMLLLISHSCFLLLLTQLLAVVTFQLVPRSVLTNNTGEGRMEMGERRRIPRQDR